MTSPYQLKYLDAIGIPVWVSRDRLVKNQQLPPAAHSEHSKQPADSDCLGSADAILHSLEKTPEKTSNKPQQKSAKQTPPRANPDTAPPLSGKHTVAPQYSNEIGRSRQHIIFAHGNINAKWLIIGESPDTTESYQNQPFPDDAGILLNNMLKSVGLKNPRTDAYLINVLKAPSLSNAIEDDSSELMTILLKKITEIKPKIIFIVGQIAAQTLLQSTEPLIRLRSNVHYLPNSTCPVIVSYYPSYLLSKPVDKHKAWEDLKLALSTLEA